MLSSPNLINPNIAYLFLLNNLLIYDLPISKFKPTFSNADIIPLTTRSLRQYNRIQLPKFNTILLSNGGILLNNGVIDESWYNESLDYAKRCINDLMLAKRFLEGSVDTYFEVRFVDELFIFTKVHNVENNMIRLKSILDCNNVDIFNQRDKIYIFPKELSKGNAIKRLKQRNIDL